MTGDDEIHPIGLVLISGSDSFGGTRMAVDLAIMRLHPDATPYILADEDLPAGMGRYGHDEAPGARLRRLIESIPMVQEVEDGDEGPGYGPPLPPASERLKRKAQWKQETAWRRRK